MRGYEKLGVNSIEGMSWYGKARPNKSLHWTAQAGFLLKECCLQRRSKLEVTMLTELGYNQTSVCTPTSLWGQLARGQPVNSSVRPFKSSQNFFIFV